MYFYNTTKFVKRKAFSAKKSGYQKIGILILSIMQKSMGLALLGCAYRTCACTSAAVDTSFWIDNILAVALGNSGYRAAF